MISITPSFFRKEGASKKVIQAQEVSADPLVYQQFPSFFILDDTSAISSKCKIELKIGVKHPKLGMIQRYIIFDVLKSRFIVLTADNKKKHVASFDFDQLSAADYVDNDHLSLRVVFKNRKGCWPGYKDPVWSITIYGMSDSQLKYIASLIQGLAGLNRTLNRNNNILCSTDVLKVGKETLRIWIGTWNMGGNPPPSQSPSKYGISPSVRSWLKLDESEYDMYVFGFQEMTEVIFSAVEALLGNTFIMISNKVMGQIGIAVFLKKRLLPFVTNIETMFEATGFGGIGTNKGFVATSMLYLDQPILFINCHLAAQSKPKRLAERMRQIKIAIRHLRLGRLFGVDVLHQFSIFWFGDMNFRVNTIDKGDWPDSGKSRQDIVSALYDSDPVVKAIPFVLQGDQLIVQKNKGIIFNGFHEGEIKFSPTYKCVHFPSYAIWEPVTTGPNSTLVGFITQDLEETDFSRAAANRDVPGREIKGYYYSLGFKNRQRREYTSKKGQTPSWCDRILYRALPSVKIEQQSYEACDDILTSDHTPVSSTFTLSVPTTTHSIPSALFHTGSVQFLYAEIIRFRHPSRTVQSFLEPKDLKDLMKRPSLAVGLSRLSSLGGTMAGHARKSTTTLKGLRISLRGSKGNKNSRQLSNSTHGQGASSVASSLGDGDTPSVPNLSVGGDQADSDEEEEILQSPKNSNAHKDTATDDTEPLPKEEFEHFEQMYLSVTYPFLESTTMKYRYICTSPAPALLDHHSWTPEWEEQYNAGLLATVEQDVEYSFTSNDLQGLQMGPFFTTREYLSSQWIIIHLLPRANASAYESVGSCIVPLAEALSPASLQLVQNPNKPGHHMLTSTLRFECDIRHEGEPSGKIRGALRLVLDSETGWRPRIMDNHPMKVSNVPPLGAVDRPKSFMAGRKKSMMPVDLSNNGFPSTPETKKSLGFRNALLHKEPSAILEEQETQVTAAISTSSSSLLAQPSRKPSENQEKIKQSVATKDDEQTISVSLPAPEIVPEIAPSIAVVPLQSNGADPSSSVSV